jgi:phosphotransferase family enzyme
MVCPPTPVAAVKRSLTANLHHMPRDVTLDLVDESGRSLGSLPTFAVDSPFWQDTEPAVLAARERFGVDVRVLHLIDGVPGMPGRATAGGTSHYLAELIDGPAPEKAHGEPEKDEPNRPVWARPGGTARIVEWAEGVVGPLLGPALQVRAWNLSSIVRLETPQGPTWCKSVPEFFAHEGPVIQWLQGISPAGLVPVPLGHDPGTHSVLLEDIPGVDLYDCDRATALRMVDRLVELQFRTIGKAAELRTLGLPDWRADALIAAIRRLPAVLTADEQNALDGLVADLPRRFAALAACGLPETLVHGDPHPGNWRSDGDSLVLIDWGDSGIGHPMLDVAAFVERTDDKESFLREFEQAWKKRVPDSDPAEAMRIIRPISALRQALVYQTFLDGIEPAEQVYHRADVPLWLRRALG